MDTHNEAKAIVEVALSQRTVKIFQMVIRELYRELDAHLETISELKASLRQYENHEEESCSTQQQE